MLKTVTNFTVLATLLLLPIFTVLASEITIRPFLIDETLTARDEVQKLITIKSDYPHRKAVLFATVNEITVDNEGEIKEFVSPIMTDRTINPASWVQISSGRIEVPAGETREVPLTIKTNPKAEPGEYHVFVGIVEAPNKPAAKAKAMAGDADGVIIKITIADERNDSMKITSFTIDRFVTSDDKKKIDIELENLGDITSAPQGEIIFYDSRGIEINSVAVSSDAIAPGEKKTVSVMVPLEDDLGRYKANLSLRYGENLSASLHDTTFFYLMPLHMMLVLFGVVLAVSLLLVLLFRRALMPEDLVGGEYEDVTMYVRDGHEPNPQDHDIDLKNKS